MSDFWDLSANPPAVNMHYGQTRAWDCKARVVAIVAGTQGGKTCFGPVWLHREIKEQGPGDYLAVSASYDLFKLKMLPEMRRVFCDILGWGVYLAGDHLITSKDGLTRIILRSAQSPGGLESATAKAAWLDEAGQQDFTVDAWEAVWRRLSLARGRILITTTPYNLGWLYSQVHAKWQAGHPDYGVINFRSIDNPAFPVEEYERARRDLPDWKFQMFYNGIFTRPAGLIYGDYDESRHLADEFSIPSDWPRYVGIDFGPVHTALVWIAEDPKTGDAFIYRESLEGGVTQPEHARGALEYKEPVKLWAGGCKSEDQFRRDWTEAGAPVVAPWISEPEAQIDRVIGFWRTDRLKVFRTCYGIRSELGSYSRVLDAAGEPTEKINEDVKYHRLAALRYIVSVMDGERPVAEEPEPEYSVRSIERQEREREGRDPYEQRDEW